MSKPVEPIKPSKYELKTRKFLTTMGYTALEALNNSCNDINSKAVPLELIEETIRYKHNVDPTSELSFIITHSNVSAWYFSIFSTKCNENYNNEMIKYEQEMKQYSMSKLKYDLQENINHKKIIEGEIKEIKSLIKKSKNER